MKYILVETFNISLTVYYNKIKYFYSLSEMFNFVYILLFLLKIETFLIEVSGFAGFGKSTAKPKKQKKRKGEFIAKELIQTEKQVGDARKADEPKLDRFGLPILTAENFFPPLAPGTDLEYVSEKEQSNMDIIRQSMINHLTLDLDLFDEKSGEEKMASSNNGDAKPWKMKLLHKNPPVLSIENFFTDAECEEYMALTKEHEESSSTDDNSPLKINSATFSTLAYSKRTSTTWYCHYSQVPSLLAKAKHLMNALPLEQMEEAQIVRYRIGEEFSWHYDEIPSEQLENGGQRIATLLVYLNSLSEKGGGGTIFRDLKGVNGIGELTMRPKKGSALLFFPAFVDGTPDDRTLHKGEVAVEEKMIAQMWIHERSYKPVVPDGNSHDAAIDPIKQKEIELGY